MDKNEIFQLGLVVQKEDGAIHWINKCAVAIILTVQNIRRQLEFSEGY